MHTVLLATYGQVRHTDTFVLCAGSVPSDQFCVSSPSSILRLSRIHGVRCGLNAALELENAAQAWSSPAHICNIVHGYHQCKSTKAHCVISTAAAEQGSSAFGQSASVKTEQQTFQASMMTAENLQAFDRLRPYRGRASITVHAHAIRFPTALSAPEPISHSQ